MRVALMALFPCALLGGCLSTSYEVQMRPVGDHYERRTTVQGSDANSSRAIRPALAAPTSSLRSDKRTIVTTLGFRTPDDVGGAGSFVTFPTSLGTLRCYQERFQGDDDLSGAIQKIFSSCDQITELIKDWLRGELGGEPGWAGLEAFLDQDLRRDLKNIFLVLQLDDGARDPMTERSSDAPVARVLSYLIEHGYFKPEEAPRLARLLGSSVLEDQEQELGLLREFLASELNNEPNAAALKSHPFLSHQAALRESFERYFSSTEFYRIARTAAAAGGSPEPSPLSVAHELLPATAWLRLFGDSLRVTLAVTAAPISTNGHWNAAPGEITWRATLPGRNDPDPGTPFVAYAVWTEPDEVFQKAHFGRVIMSRDRLAEYCFWRRGLDDPEGAAWDAALARLMPGSPLAALLDDHMPERARSAAGMGLNMLQNAMEEPPRAAATAPAGIQK